MSASCEELEWKVESNTYSLGDQTADEYVNTTFEMVDAVRSVEKASFAWMEEARTVRFNVRRIVLLLRYLAKGSGSAEEDAIGRLGPNGKYFRVLAASSRRTGKAFWIWFDRAVAKICGLRGICHSTTCSF